MLNARAGSHKWYSSMGGGGGGVGFIVHLDVFAFDAAVIGSRIFDLDPTCETDAPAHPADRRLNRSIANRPRPPHAVALAGSLGPYAAGGG